MGSPPCLPKAAVKMLLPGEEKITGKN